jgi:hypothetical protein
MVQEGDWARAEGSVGEVREKKLQLRSRRSDLGNGGVGWICRKGSSAPASRLPSKLSSLRQTTATAIDNGTVSTWPST